jgi:hypothetical protein
MQTVNTKRSSFKHRRKLKAFGLLSVALTGCAAVQQIDSKVSNKGQDESMKSHTVSITRKIVIAHPPHVVFSFIAAEDVLPKVLTGYGPLPAVLKTSENTGPWTTIGSVRRVHLADQSTLREELTHYEPASHFAYRVSDFGNPVLRSLATAAKGEWTFTALPEGTHVSWTYTFTAKNALAALPLSGVIQVLWRGYMDVCLENTARLLSKA